MLYLSDNNNAAKSVDDQYSEDFFNDTVKDDMSGYMDYAKQSRPLRMNFRNLLSRIYRYQPFDMSRSMLDVGCAYGFFLDEARQMGISVQGLDLSESAIQWMQEHLGIKGTVGLSSDAPEGPFDLITAIEVIEHTRDPHLFLDDLYGRLKEGGLLVIKTGTNDTLTARLLGKRWWYLNPHVHYSIFSRYALEKLFSDKKFTLLEHSIIPFDWVGLNNMMLKLARMFESKQLGLLASKLPTIIVPVFHYSYQILIARKH